MDYTKLSKEELIRILELRENPIQTNSPKTVFDYLKPWGGKEQEHFIVLMLDGAHQVKNLQIVSMGLVNRTLVHPREIFAPAIENRATAIIIAHNHPSGNLEPSEDDLTTTNRIWKAGLLLGIEVLDHIIFSNTEYLSMKVEGLMP